jgi:hypothetical protein
LLSLRKTIQRDICKSKKWDFFLNIGKVVSIRDAHGSHDHVTHAPAVRAQVEHAQAMHAHVMRTRAVHAHAVHGIFMSELTATCQLSLSTAAYHLL